MDYNCSDKHIAVVDDDDRIRELVAKVLTSHGFIVSTARDASEIYEILNTLVVDLLIVDIMMPKTNGIELSKNIRETSVVPIIILTAINSLDSKMQGLGNNIDDYITKPFNPEELILRIKNILWRNDNAYKGKQQSVSFGNMLFDLISKQLYCNDDKVKLTTGEKVLLSALAQNHNSSISRKQLAQLCDVKNERSIDVQVIRLRSKIETDAKNPLYLQTVRNKGYMLKVDMADI